MTYSTDDTKNPNNIGDDSAPAWVSGPLWAFEKDAHGDDVIREFVSDDAWNALRKFGRRYDVRIDGETLFEDLHAVPMAVVNDDGVEVTREGAAEFVEDCLYGLPDAEEVGAELEAKRSRLRAERSQKFRDQQAAKTALAGRGVSASTEFTLTEVERVGGDAGYVRAAQTMITRANTEAWALRRRDDERLPIVTAAELLKLGAPVEIIDEMTQVTAADRITAATDLAVEYDRFRAAVSRKSRATGTGTDALDAGLMGPDEIENQPPTRYLVGEIVPEASLVHIVAPPSSFKSFFAFDMTCSLAMGIPFGREHAVPTEGVPVLYVAAEDARGYRDRLAAWRAHNNVDRAAMRARLHMQSRAVQLGSDEDTAWLAAKVAETGAKFVVVDTQALSTVGLDENSATDQGQVIRALRAIVSNTGATVAVVHHAAAGSDTGRGSTAWHGGTDTVLRLRRESESTPQFTVKTTKQKNDRQGLIYDFEVVEVEVPGDDNGRVSLCVRAVGAQEAAKVKQQQLTEKDIDVLTLIRDLCAREGGGLTQTQIIRTAHARGLYKSPTSSQCGDVVANLMNRGYVVDKARRGANSKKIMLADKTPTGGWPEGFDPTPGLLAGRDPVLDPEREEHEMAVRRVLDILARQMDRGGVNDQTTKQTFTDNFAATEHDQIIATAWERWKKDRPGMADIATLYVEADDSNETDRGDAS
ncbi:AAA family ATPase [Gordonia sp. DT219]|uniref:AAA family ATPase n=1 Tax=Gordonia sp. DT219 TaxID=3416658 RepID=UPI003CF81092